MKNLVAVCILISALVLIGCSKYEDGPGFSFRTKKARLVNKWKLEKAFMNGMDIMNGAPLPQDPPTWVEFKSDHTVESSYRFNGQWEFDDSKENILIKDENSNLLWTLKILRLKNDELWIYFEIDIQTFEDHYVSY